MATKLGGFPYKSQSHLENIKRIGSQTFLLVCRQLGWRSCFTILEGCVEKEVGGRVEGHSGANLCVSWWVGEHVNWTGPVNQRSVSDQYQSESSWSDSRTHVGRGEKHVKNERGGMGCTCFRHSTLCASTGVHSWQLSMDAVRPWVLTSGERERKRERKGCLLREE